MMGYVRKEVARSTATLFKSTTKVHTHNKEIIMTIIFQGIKPLGDHCWRRLIGAERCNCAVASNHSQGKRASEGGGEDERIETKSLRRRRRSG